MTSTAAPWVSIVTASFNAEATILDLAESLAGQSFRDFEWILQDGLSEDRTVELAVSVRDSNCKPRSERDRGIYDALNTAISRAQGEYLLFLGADDVLHDPSTLEILNTAAGGAHPPLLLGSAKYDSGEVFESRLGFQTRIMNTVHHQGALYHRSLFDSFKYDQRFPIVADYELNYICASAGTTAMRVDTTIADCGDNGASRSGSEVRLYLDMHAIRCKHSPAITSTVYLLIGLANVLRRRIFKK